MKHLGTVTLESERLILRKFLLQDATILYENLYSQPIVNRFLSWNTHSNLEETQKVIQEWISNYSDKNYRWVVVDKSSMEPVGSIEVVKFQEKHLIAEVGYQYGINAWGKGFATEALNLVLDFLFHEVGVYMVEAYVRSENIGSGRVCEKALMKCDAILPKRRVDKLDGHRDDLKIYSKREDF